MQKIRQKPGHIGLLKYTRLPAFPVNKDTKKEKSRNTNTYSRRKTKNHTIVEGKQIFLQDTYWRKQMIRS